jgi:hypothetical protein
MTLTIEIDFECVGEREASSLEAALSPDNHPLPKDQRLDSERKGGTLTYRISSPRASSCVSSALSLLSDAGLFSQIWELAS